ncbi:MAG: hypothetical protein ACE366_14265 [Bradymonadia bacterium]
MGSDGWKLGRIIALHYREDQWPAEQTAPYQVMLEDDHALIYVPVDDARYCREATGEDVRIARRMDALAALPTGSGESALEPFEAEGAGTQLSCADTVTWPRGSAHRSGRCHCCHSCPRSWSAVELYSEHYRCAARNGLRVTQHAVDLGTVRVGDSLHHPGEGLPSGGGFMQCPTLVRLPPGVRFSDDGALNGKVQFDPHREATYTVEFVAVSTADWDDPAVGLVRLEITLVVEGNEVPAGFDIDSFDQRQRQASAAADRSVRALFETWGQWEQRALGNRETCEVMCAELRRLRALLEQHPHLDGGRWWSLLGGLHMNVHKLLENTLFECELYLGHALTFGDPEVRRMAEQNLAGCYQKRLLETARFMWIDGLKQMMQGEWVAAAETLRLAAAKQDGWGWAVNYGDIWLSESAARLVHGATLTAHSGTDAQEGRAWIAEAERLLARCVARSGEARVFGPEGHPWAAELSATLRAYRDLEDDAVADWLDALKQRTIYWCAQALGGAAPFPPQPRPRLEDADALVRRLPRHNA